MTDELGKMPEATTEEPQLHPGGPDSIDDPKYGATPETPLVADASPQNNPAVPDSSIEEISESDDAEESPEPDEPASDGTTEPTD